jgi:hypothetical protein
MKKLLLPCLLFGFALSALAVPTMVTTTKRSAVIIGTGSFALVKGTKLEVVSREGGTLIVKYRSSQGKVPLADTDYPVDATGDEAAPAVEAVAPAAPAKPATPVPAVAKQPAATKPVPPALNTSGTGQQPATNYGKAVQKAKQVTETQKSTRVDPTKDIMDEEAKK